LASPATSFVAERKIRKRENEKFTTFLLICFSVCRLERVGEREETQLNRFLLFA